MVTNRPARPFLGCGTVPTSLANLNLPRISRGKMAGGKNWCLISGYTEDLI